MRRSSTNRKDGPIRADKALKLAYPSLTQRQIAEVFEGELVRDSEGRALQKGNRIVPELSLDCTGLDFHLRSLRKKNTRLVVPIVTESDHWAVVDKPPGMPSHPLSLFDTDTITHWALSQFPEIGSVFTQIQPIVVPHRLDTGTSGLLIVAKDQSAFDYWREEFTKKKVRKSYLAWCWGTPEWDEKDVDFTLAHDPSDPRRMIVVEPTVRFRPPVLPSRSQIKVVRRVPEDEMVLCEINCQTGVTHQVRVHLSFLGLPLVGDTLYDAQFEKRKLKPSFHQLRACKLENAEHQYYLDVSDFFDNLPTDAPHSRFARG